MKIQAPSPEDFETCKCNSYRLCTGLGALHKVLNFMHAVRTSVW